MGMATTTQGSQQNTLILATAAGVVGVLAGVLLTVGYGEAVSTLVRTMTGEDGVSKPDERSRIGEREGNEEGQRKRGGVGLGDEEDRKGDGRVEAKRNVKEGIEGCIGNTPLIRIVSLDVACVRA